MERTDADIILIDKTDCLIDLLEEDGIVIEASYELWEAYDHAVKEVKAALAAAKEPK